MFKMWNNYDWNIYRERRAKMTPLIFDNEDGIMIQFPLESGLLFGLELTDEAAQEMIDIIQNKLNARIS